MGSTADKARKARERARTQNSNRGSTGSTDKLVMDLTRGKSSLLDKAAGRYVNKPEQRAANVMQQRRALDTSKTAARATAIEKRVAKKKAADTLRAGVSGSSKKNSILQPNAKPKGLNDFLKEGKRPPSKNKKIPSEADVIIKGYNDKKTLSKNKKRK